MKVLVSLLLLPFGFAMLVKGADWPAVCVIEKAELFEGIPFSGRPAG